MAFEEPKESKFNAGIAKLQRIDAQRQMMQMSRIYHNWHIFADCLLNIRTELNERMDTEERDAADIHEEDVKTAIDNHKVRKQKSTKNWMNIDPLKKYERYLGDLEYKFKMSMPDKDEDDGL